MDREVVLFTKPEELVAWADTHDALLNLSVEDADSWHWIGTGTV